MDVMIPPWVRPESPETIRIIDDATVAFQPVFGRGTTQRGIFADPRWGLQRRYRGLRSDEKAAIQIALNETRGQLNILRVTPHTPIRGSFATSELITNNTFANGTTGWTAGSEWSIAVADRVMRATRTAMTASGQMLQTGSSVTIVQYAPYVLRYMMSQGRGSFTVGHSANYSGTSNFGLLSTAFGLYAAETTSSSTSVIPGVLVSDTSGMTAGDYFMLPYISLARCALVDAGVNLLTRSDEFDNAAWTKGRSAATANAMTAPDGTTTADAFVEDNTTGDHYFTTTSSLTVSSAAADYSVAVAAKLNGRNFIRLLLRHAGGDLYQTFDLGTGAVGVTSSTGTGWGNLRASIVALGNGWYECHLTGRKTGAQTAIDVFFLPQSADNASTYLGNSGTACFLWRATISQSSVPSRLVQTTSSALSSGAAPTGSAINTKGWPASTTGLLLTGDWFEWQGELKQLTAPVNSDAAGLAYLRFRPGLAGAPADNDPIIVQEPFGRFIYPAGTREFENLFGIYGDCEMNLEEIYV